MNESERKLLQEALDKVNTYIKKIEDLFFLYGGIKKMSIGMTIGEVIICQPHTVMTIIAWNNGTWNFIKNR
ncbi:hypothetical protein [Lysinibacillus pakistanensis]